jgi:hypothetical protein
MRRRSWFWILLLFCATIITVVAGRRWFSQGREPPSRALLDAAHPASLLARNALLEDAGDLEELLSAAASPPDLMHTRGPQRLSGEEGTLSQSDRIDEWRALPREGFSLAEYFAKRWSIVEPQLLVRHVVLNPSDIRLSEETREILEAIVAHYKVLISRASSLRSKYAVKELRAPVAAGAARGTPIERLRGKAYLDTLPKEKREAYTRMITSGGGNIDDGFILDASRILPAGEQAIMTQVEGETIYAATLAELPQAAKAEEIRVYLLMEFCGSVTGLFVREAGLTTDKQSEILNELADCIAKR